MTNYLANTPFHIIMATALFAFVLILTVAAIVSKARATAKAKARAEAITRHPAGRGRNAPRVLEDTRHIDRPGYDFVNGPL